jgi:hypothetical protein
LVSSLLAVGFFRDTLWWSESLGKQKIAVHLLGREWTLDMTRLLITIPL